MKAGKVFMAAFATVLMAACSNDDELIKQSFDNQDSNDPIAYASFAISVPHAANSRAVSSRVSESGTDEENNVKSLHIFIYDVDPPYTPTVAKFTVADKTLIKDGELWKTKDPISTKKNDKYIFAGVNLNEELVNHISSDGLGAFYYKAFEQEVAKLADETNGFVMFNETYPQATEAGSLYASKADAAENHIPIKVSRVVAKAAVFKTSGFHVNGGGTMTDLKFGWRNINKSFYLVQDSRNGIITDHNWTVYAFSDFAKGEDAIDIYEPSEAVTKYSYTTENAFDYSAEKAFVNGATYISLSGVFTPDKVISAKKDTPESLFDFESVANSQGAGKTFYVVRTSNGTANYFIDGTAAKKYAELNGIESYKLEDNTYSNGVCYFHIFVNANAVLPQMPYGVYRNQYFKININSIQAPGNPSDDFDKDTTIKSNAWVSADVEVVPWEIIEENHDL